ncbi:mannonate dehydratase [Demequina sp. NBRC 110055]|uniref:mannonate dehydratase n=1 Tax=Demequina sp. NBRC 110055 TaxID=1570344 RepID=UPI000A01A154|nr:mannonate dehydratase [Demequina sp. NBRC 110055]
MEHTWRWFGPHDPISLRQIRQTGATGVVTALHEIPNGQVWPVHEIAARKQAIEEAGLTWSVVESIPVHEDIKSGEPGCERWIDAWAQTVRNLGECGIHTVCYNFMPVLDWTRTDLRFALPDGTWALRFDHRDLAVFDLHVLGRADALDDYSEADRADAARRYEAMTQSEVDALSATILAGLPGSEESSTVESLRADLRRYERVDEAAMRRHLATFLAGVLPAAEAADVRLAIHPDDPPRSLLGLPRIVSTAHDARWILAQSPSAANGLTLCTGSYGVRPDNDVVEMAREFASRIHFVHLRSTQREGDGRSFHEAPHLEGDVDMVGVMSALVAEERRRAAHGGARLPMRPDHGHQMLYDQEPGRRANPGYTLIGRLKGLAELRGLERAVNALFANVGLAESLGSRETSS